MSPLVPNPPQDVVTCSVQEAAARWARGVPTAPRQFDELITKISVQDEVLQRVAREIVRRDVLEQRSPSVHKRANPVRVAPESVDPFGVTIEDLRGRSEHVAVCLNCAGQGGCTCTTCNGTKQMRCNDCGGSGQVLKHYQKTSRWIQCKTCRTKGTVKCNHCAATGWLICRQCSGSGHETAWLTYNQTTRWEVTNHPSSPIVAAHRQLNEPRFLAPKDLAAFSVVASHEGTDVSYRELPVRPADARLERISQQQVLKLSVVRRDATFEMAGTTGVLVLSGRDLAGAKLEDALRPIKRRNMLGAIACSVAVVGSMVGLSSLTRDAEYYATSNRLLLLFWAAGIACAAVSIAALLRAWRPGGVRGLRSYEKVTLGLSLALFAALPVTRAVWAPSLSEAQRALAAGDVPRARLVAAALAEADPNSVDVRGVADEVTLSEAKAEPLPKRLGLLDSVAVHGGPLGARAAHEAEAARLEHVKSLAATGDEITALTILDKWYPPPQAGNANVGEARAALYDAVRSKCSTEACTFIAARHAADAAPSAERTALATKSRDALRAELVAQAPAGEPALAKVQRLKKIVQANVDAAAAQIPDDELLTLAQTAGTQATNDLRGMAVVGGSTAVAEALIGGEFAAVGPARLTVDGPVAIRLLSDGQSRCVGLYAVGAKPGARAVKGSRWDANALLSQAVGRSTTVHAATAPGGTAKWSEGGVPVTARWDGSQLVELRVGALQP